MAKGLMLHCVPDGSYFEIVGLEKTYRDLRVKRMTDSSVLIEGKMVNGEALKDLGSNYTISLSTPVRMIKAPNKNK
jgi:hypothetical protein